MATEKKTERFETGPAAFGRNFESEFSIHTELAALPISDCPAYLQEVIGGVCVSGAAVVTAFNRRFTLQTGMVFLLLPWQLVSIREVSGDFRLTFYRASEEMFTDSLSSLWRVTPDFFFFMSKHIASEAAPENIRRFLNYCDLLEYRARFVPEAFRRESVMHNHKFHYTRKEEFAYRFLHMVLEDHSPDKDVAYYAENLGVSPKYLTTLIRSISGHSARDWIVRYMLLEIKSLLRESSMDLKSIAARLQFPDQSTLSRFFRHYTGLTPSKYRKKIFF